MRLVTPRKAGSAWARSNKERIARLEGAGKLADSGRRIVEAAKADGSWSRYDSAEALELPNDLRAALAASPEAERNFDDIHGRRQAHDPALADRCEAARDPCEAHR